MAVQVGQEAPDFTLKSSDMEDVTLSSFRGDKNVVLLFVPLAFTGVCTQELCSVRDSLNTYASLDAEVLGLSVDSPFAQKEWKAKEGLNFTLVSDFKPRRGAGLRRQFRRFLSVPWRGQALGLCH